MDALDFDNRVTLADVIRKDRDLYDEICRSFADIFRVALKILDDSGNRLLDIPGPAEVCQYVYSLPGSRSACIQIVSSIRRDTPSFRTIDKRTCFSGAEYRMVPIHHDTDVIGKLVFGPFLPTSVSKIPPDFMATDPNVDPHIAWAKTQHFRRLNSELANKVAQHMATVIEVMSFVGLKGRMTTDMHVQSISEAYGELTQKHEELQENMERLRHVNIERAAFLDRISQELRGPLTNIIGQAEMLIEGFGGEISEDQEDFLRTIIDEGERTAAVTRVMEELSWIERGEIDLMTELVPARDLLMTAVEYGQKVAARHDVAVVFRRPLPLPDLRVDDEKIGSALSHLIDNAVKFTAAGGHVDLGAAVEERTDADNQLCTYVTFKIQDTGIGIQAADVPRLFDAFFTAHEGEGQGYGGTGVGLTIAKAYIEAHDGIIEVESDPGDGATFRVLIPTA